MNSWPCMWCSKSDESWPILFTLSAIFAVTWYAWVCIKAFKTTSSWMPPGPSGLPIVGNLLSLDPELHSYFTRLAHTYGPIFKLQLGTKICIVINSPWFAREVLKDRDVTFANRDVSIAAQAASYGGSDILYSPYGSEWRILKKIGKLKMLGETALESGQAIRHNQVRKTVKYLYNRIGLPVKIREQLFLTSFNVITHLLWNGGISEEGDERARLGAEFRKVVSEMNELLGKPNLSDFYPSLGWFDFQGIKKQMDKLVQRLDCIFEQMISQRLKIQEDGIATNKSQEFLTTSLNLVQEGRDSKTPLTMNNIKGILMDMMIGGTDTTSNTIEFALAEAMRNPVVMQKAQHELEVVVGKNNIVQESHIRKLPYLQAVMKEALRLYPAGPLLAPHSPSETCTIGGYTIPKGCQILVNVWAIHRDPNNWENPLEFDPSRFLDGKWDYNGNEFKYLPFGSGRRMCPGIGMAERMMMLLLATFLHSFDWKLPPGVKLDLSAKFGLVLKKRIPLVAIPTPKLSDPALYE